jgi:hypothetical protein
MSDVTRPRRSAHDAEYASMLRQIRLSECAEVCARSTWLQMLATELRATAERLIRESQALRRPEHASRGIGGHWLSL